MEIQTISLSLVRQLKEIFNQVGLRATIYQYTSHKNINKKTSFTVSVRGNEMLHKFMNIISPKNPKHINKYNAFTQSFK